MSKTTVAVLCGGTSCERDISLVTGERVLAGLDERRYDASLLDTADRALLVQLAAAPPDVAFIALHGRGGEDGVIQGFLETLGIPHTGSAVLASAVAMDKSLCKQVLNTVGIQTPAHVLAKACESQQPIATALPVVVKPNAQGSSDGVTIVRDAQQLQPALTDAWRFESTVLVETYIQGMEITCAVLGNRNPEILPLIEIVPAKGVYDREAKYVAGATDEICPARLPDRVTARAQEAGKNAHLVLGCRGVSRTDMIVTPDGTVYVMEVNTMPGMTPTSLLPRAAAAAGYSFSQLLDRMIQCALED